MKSDETLIKLSQNPHYNMSEEESQRLDELASAPRTSSVKEDSKKKVAQTTYGSATVKETGKLQKHPSDPVSE